MPRCNATARTRRRIQFSTRAILLLIAVAAVFALFMSMHLKRAFDQRRVVSGVHDLGGMIYYDYQKAYAEIPNMFDPRAQPPGPAWMRELIGSEHFEDVVMVSLRDKPITNDHLKELAKLPRLENLDLSNTQITNNGLAHLKQLENLRYLSLCNTDIDDEGLQHLAVHKNLYALILDGTHVSDAGLKHLEGLTQLEEWLGLCDTHVTDEGIQCLSRLTKLKSLNVLRTKVTADGAKELRRSLPTTDISYGK